MTKLAIDIRKSEREAVKRGTRGWSIATKDSKGEMISLTRVYACYCLSRGLMSDYTPCPAHHRPIGTHPARMQNLGLRR